MITCRLAIMTIYAALGATGSALADGGDTAKAPYPGECLTCCEFRRKSPAIPR